MTDFNLPPGCRVSDIPGNRPEDIENEAFWEALDKALWEHRVKIDWDGPRLPMDTVCLAIEEAHKLGLKEGFEQGKQEAQIDEVAYHQQLEEELDKMEQAVKEIVKLVKEL